VHEKDKEPSSYLKPREVFSIKGPITYRESIRAWSTIHMKKEILAIFPQLKEKRTKFDYTMHYNRSPKDLKKILDKLEKDEVVPILLLFGKTKEK